MTQHRGSFDVLVSEAEAEPTDGWDFSWFEGRATEDRPPWGYARRAPSRLPAAGAVLDIQTGGGEVFAEILAACSRPSVVRATESWAPNIALARTRLAPYGGEVVDVADHDALPFGDAMFDLAISRHPTAVVWPEIARVLRPGGVYFAQHVGAGSNRELTDFIMGTQPVSDARSADRAVSEAQAVGLEVIDVQRASLEVRFFDVGAVVYFLRKVIWTVPGFTVERYHEQLAAMHAHIQEQGAFVSHAERYLIEARRPARAA